MISYLKKDIRVSANWLIIVVVYCIVVGFLLVRERGESLYFIEFLIPFFAVYFPLGRLMNAEDSKDTRDFLRRMPQGVCGRVIARIIYILALLIFSSAVKIFYKYLLIEGYDLLSEGKLEKETFFFLAFISYFLIQLIVYYRTSYHTAQNTGLIACAIIFIIALIGKYTDIRISIPDINIAVIIAVFVLLIIGLTIGAVKAEKAHLS